MPLGSKQKKTLLNHHLVPKHEVINETQAQELMKRFGVSKEQLPSILKTDPVIEEIGAKPGDIVKITRKSPIAGESVYYRVVV
jgi:DNA-directed RNA polymerase subunit H